MFLPRVLTAFVGIPLVLWLIHLGSLPFLVFVLAVTALALYEYGLVLEAGRRPVRRWLTLWGGLAVGASLAVGTPRLGPWGNGLAAFALTACVTLAVLLEILCPGENRSLDRVALSVFGVMFVGWTLPHLHLLRDLRPHGEGATWMLMACVWATDIAAYVAGHAAGRRPLTTLSPKKTWEGAAAGLAASVLAALGVRGWLLPGALSPFEAGLLGAGVGVLGQLSDLGESMLKRASGTKESGYVLPGHGGVLDRFDSFLLAGPAFYYALAARWP